MIRVFMALEASDEVKRKLTMLSIDVPRTDAKVRWVKPDNMHLTLVFVGDVEEKSVESLPGVLDAVASKSPPFIYKVSGLGFFGNRRSPRILWAGITEGHDLIKELQVGLSRQVKELGMAVDEREPIPHLTVARIRSSTGTAEFIKVIEPYRQKEFGEVSVSRLVLMKSELRPEGALYTVIHEAGFTA